MDDAPLPEGRARVLTAIEALIRLNQGPPTFREIMDVTGLALSTVKYHVGKLVDSGHITTGGRGAPRSIQIVNPTHCPCCSQELPS